MPRIGQVRSTGRATAETVGAMPNRRVVAVAYDGLCAFEFGIATELFGLPRPEFEVPWYEYRVVSVDDGPLGVLGGLTVSAPVDMAAVAAAGTIVLPGWKGADVTPPPELLTAICRAHEAGARVMSICSGAFVVAAVGLLDGAAATTHWRYAERLAAMYPSIDVRPDVLYVDNGQVLTSAGSAAGLDLGLHLIRRDHGAAVAAEVARRLVIPPQRDGGQAQFIRRSVVDHADGSVIANVMAWALARLGDELSVDDLARRALMSPRTFARRFRDEIGTTPHAWLTRQRVAVAQELLETSRRSIDEIAAATGLGSAATLRHHFRHHVRTTPTRYRSAFARSSADARSGVDSEPLRQRPSPVASVTLGT